MKEEIELAKAELLKAIKCLYLATDSSVAGDINYKVWDYIKAVEAQQPTTVKGDEPT